MTCQKSTIVTFCNNPASHGLYTFPVDNKTIQDGTLELLAQLMAVISLAYGTFELQYVCTIENDFHYHLVRLYYCEEMLQSVKKCNNVKKCDS